ncbi:MAG: DUF2207 domain-containing protein [bacterium]|nr:DUF2207 domain-containing protein [bacterium]
MSNWQLIKELFKGAGFYKKQFVFFVAISLVIIGLFGIKSYHSYMSADPMQAPSQPSTGNSQSVNLNVTNDGRIFKDGHVVSTVQLDRDYDIVRYKILDKPGVYIDNLTVEVRFQSNINKPQIYYEVQSKHTDAGYTKNTYATMLDDHTIIFSGQFLGPDSFFAVYTRLPKGIITPPWWRSSAFDITSLSISTWIIIGLLLPLITLIFLSSMLIKRWIYNRVDTKQMVATLPENIPPAVIGVLVHGRIGAREISATMIDLAQRGYIHIYEGHNNFSFGRGRALESEEIYNLNKYEKLLLSKIFETKSATNNLRDINKALDRSLFSEKMAQVFLEIYNLVTDQGYFQQNPGLTHQKYKLNGIILFFAGSLGFILNIIFNRTFPFLIFFWIGMMASATLILYFAPKMPILTPKGKSARLAWLRFRNYLIQSKPIDFQDANQSPYTKYLAYAVCLNAEVDWTKHFFEVPFARPYWFDSDPSIVSIEDFANLLFPLIAYTSNNLIVSRTPIID